MVPVPIKLPGAGTSFTKILTKAKFFNKNLFVSDRLHLPGDVTETEKAGKADGLFKKAYLQFTECSQGCGSS